MIEDKVIESILLRYVDEDNWENEFKIIKNNLKEKGYEVEEEKKTALEKARECSFFLTSEPTKYPNKTWINSTNVFKKIDLYEKAIEELQQLVIDEDLVHNIKSWIRGNENVGNWNHLDIKEAISYFKKILKQLGIKILDNNIFFEYIKP